MRVDIFGTEKCKVTFGLKYMWWLHVIDTQESAVTLRAPCALTLYSGASDALKMHNLL